MNEEFNKESSSVLPQPETDTVVLIKRLQQQVAFLEKKIDILINQSQGESSREKYFSKPYRSFDRSHRHNKGGRDSSHAERGFDQGRRFGKPGGEQSRGFGQKKDYARPRESNSGPERHFEKRSGEEHRGFGRKKKPFFHKRRDRG